MSKSKNKNKNKYAEELKDIINKVTGMECVSPVVAALVWGSSRHPPEDCAYWASDCAEYARGEELEVQVQLTLEEL